MLQTVGISKTVGYARRLGIGDVPSVPSLALGSGEVTLMSMTSAYSVFAASGVRRPVVLIRRVEDQQGRVLFQANPAPEQVLSPATAFLMTSMLADVVNRGTAYRARSDGFMLPAAGKTGTTNDFVDAWFVGFTPKLVSGVWIGFDQPRTIIANGFAGDLAVPLWASFMKAATAKDKPQWYTPPPGIVTSTICVSFSPETGDCEREGSEYFARGTVEPQTYVMHVPPPDGEQMVRVEIGREVPVPAIAPPPVVVSSTSPGVFEVPPSAEAAAAAAEENAPQKKRGFWGKIFGSKK
jgi:membrane carboxypeptidase/penicillin-binding protein